MLLKLCSFLAVVSLVLGVDSDSPVKEKRAEPPTQAPVACTDETKDKSPGCGQWKFAGYCESSSVYHGFMMNTCFATCGGCIMPPTQPPKVNEQNCLQAHNAKRALHGASPLVWDDTLAQHAKAWADHLLTLGKMEHAEGTGEGENLFAGGGKVYSCVDAVESWYGEVKDYNFNNPPTTKAEFYKPPAIGHFTQVVWKGSTKLGVALATTVKQGVRETYIVARYSPSGNYLGQFPQNVGRKNS